MQRKKNRRVIAGSATGAKGATHKLAANGDVGKTVAVSDQVGKRGQSSHASGNVTQFADDRLNRCTAENDPFGKQLKHEYDFAGNLTRITERYGPNGRKREFLFGVKKRVSAIVSG